MSGRRGKPAPSPVAQLAAEMGIPVLKPSRPNAAEFVAELAALAPDCCAVVAYGALLSPALLAVPTRGWVNLHFSLLPAWRGAAPVQAAIAAGDTVTGATTFLIEPQLDSGPVYGVVTETIKPTDTAGDLLGRLAISGAALLEATIDGIEEATLVAKPQPADGVSVAPKITVEQARVRWDLPAHAIDRLIRAVTPNPGAWTMIGDLRVKLGPVTLVDVETLAPGQIAVQRTGVLVGYRLDRRWRWASCSRRARSPWLPPTGRAARASTTRCGRHERPSAQPGPPAAAAATTQAAGSRPPRGV